MNKADFNLPLVAATPKHWSTYTTDRDRQEERKTMSLRARETDRKIDSQTEVERQKN